MRYDLEKYLIDYGRLILALMLLYSWTSSAFADDIAVIVNRNNSISVMDRVQVDSLYLGRTRTFPDGSIAHVIDYPRDASLREQFFQRISGMPLNKVNAFWARLEVRLKSGDTIPISLIAINMLNWRLWRSKSG